MILLTSLFNENFRLTHSILKLSNKSLSTFTDVNCVLSITLFLLYVYKYIKISREGCKYYKYN